MKGKTINNYDFIKKKNEESDTGKYYVYTHFPKVKHIQLKVNLLIFRGQPRGGEGAEGRVV